MNVSRVLLCCAQHSKLHTAAPTRMPEQKTSSSSIRGGGQLEPLPAPRIPNTDSTHNAKMQNHPRFWLVGSRVRSPHTMCVCLDGLQPKNRGDRPAHLRQPWRERRLPEGPAMAVPDSDVQKSRGEGEREALQQEAAHAYYRSVSCYG